MPQDRRKYFRHSVSIPASLSIGSGDFYSVEILNLSLQGMQVQADAWPIQQSIPKIRLVTPSQPVDARLKFDLSLKDDTIHKIIIDCQIITLNRCSQNIYQASLRYVELDDTTATLLESFVDQID